MASKRGERGPEGAGSGGENQRATRQHGLSRFKHVCIFSQCWGKVPISLWTNAGWVLVVWKRGRDAPPPLRL